ncbi:cyclic-phosphate processing receiver domain-containing protein [Halalkalibacterium ligniniphilum]|uniref:cyclic-phosphate processing receiver domain-containing protein n=1 Tax=Halalkalibacterium ligniniphilum TaxID=1134413 RepID=UPI00034583A1|nr:cyclic-phosphate processing receiver domain-containing protein [Halalkalibacterium ligniniphilum]
MEKINVFLDDYRACPQGYFLAENIDECFMLLKKFKIDHLSLDHDLENKKRNGLMLVKMMVEQQLFAERITIHSANAGGGKAMYNYLKTAQKERKMPKDIKITLRPLPLH